MFRATELAAMIINTVKGINFFGQVINRVGKITLFGFGLASGQTILFSGHEDDHARHTHGVDFMFAAETTKALMEWEPINARLIVARFYGTPTNIPIIQGYAPTNDAEPEEKAEFYDTLQT